MRRDPGADAREDVRTAPAGDFGEQGGLVGVGEQPAGAGDEAACLFPVEAGELLRGVGGERQAEFTALDRVALHGRGITGGDHDQPRPVGRCGQRREVEERGLGHGARVEGSDLVLVQVGGAQETRGSEVVGDPDVPGVHAVCFQPVAVRREVGPDRAEQERVQAERPQAVGDVGRGAAVPYPEVVDEEGQRDVGQLVGQQLVGEAPGEGRQVVGGDGTGDGDAHDGSLPWGPAGPHAAYSGVPRRFRWISSVAVDRLRVM